MLDIECTTVESAESIKEALTGLFGEVEGVKIQNWPEDKVFYNDYEYLGMDSEVALRFKVIIIMMEIILLANQDF